MFKKEYRYFVSYFYEIDNYEFHISDGFISISKKLNKEEFLSRIRKEIKNEIERQTHRECNCIAIINWRKMK